MYFLVTLFLSILFSAFCNPSCMWFRKFLSASILFVTHDIVMLVSSLLSENATATFERVFEIILINRFISSLYCLVLVNWRNFSGLYGSDISKRGGRKYSSYLFSPYVTIC